MGFLSATFKSAARNGIGQSLDPNNFGPVLWSAVRPGSWLIGIMNTLTGWRLNAFCWISWGSFCLSCDVRIRASQMLACSEVSPISLISSTDDAHWRGNVWSPEPFVSGAKVMSLTTFSTGPTIPQFSDVYMANRSLHRTKVAGDIW
jgi:hypothetical protein